jgi:hypothetical protein
MELTVQAAHQVLLEMEHLEQVAHQEKMVLMVQVEHQE